MLEPDNIYENIKEIINNIPENFKILEETIDIDVQKDFFESTKNIKIDPEKDIVAEMISCLNCNETTVNESKLLLQKLALIDSVEAFRAIEAFSMNPRKELKEWAILSLQQSKMVLQCSLLDEQQVFISTGLGGKKDKLRFYLIFPYNQNIQDITSIQKNALKNELDFFLSKHNAETEFTEFEKRYATAMTLIPLKAPIPDIIRDVLNECNQLGDFLSSDVMITNMKKLSGEEIISMIDNTEE
jgi:hypothetical protein